MAIVNKVDKRIKIERDGAIKYQIITFCFLNNIQISSSDLLCLTELAKLGSSEVTTFCKSISKKLPVDASIVILEPSKEITVAEGLGC